MRSARSSTPDPDDTIHRESLRQWLNAAVEAYNHPSFIEDDPISIPHRYTSRQDIEIAGFFAAIMSWGQRKTIIRKASDLMELMDDSPHDFILHHSAKDRKRFLAFTHRTLQPDDILFLTEVLQHYYQKHESLEQAFATHIAEDHDDVFHGLQGFYNMVFDRPWVLEGTRKHIASPARKSSCKRLNMYLRWMVRRDDRGVDFGLWNQIAPARLIIPLDIHVGNVARRLGLLHRPVNDWQAAKELTETLKQFDPVDPVKYDFALFGAGVLSKKITPENPLSSDHRPGRPRRPGRAQ